MDYMFHEVEGLMLFLFPLAPEGDRGMKQD